MEGDRLKQIIIEMWQEDGYKTTLTSALDSAKQSSRMFTNVAIVVNTHLGGSLGTRSTRKQIQAIVHHTAGNLQLQVNSSSTLPATCFLPVNAFIGKGKNPYYNFFKEILNLLQEGTEALDKQIFDAKYHIPDEQENGSGPAVKGKEIKFVPRQLLHGPGSKEGLELALHKENRVIQLVVEGDL